ncbi:MAG TPA: acyltransferase [Candidatus Ligilactobacillus excrementipullorum]|nr:acyltransferase [Candidatus Ligilactobacillus excrementipullorum]
MKVKPRMSNFELLRIIAMLFIVLHHSIVHGVLGEFFPRDALQLYTIHPAVYSTARLLAFGGKVGVGLFVLITGYFSIHSKMKWSKIIKIWVPTFCYTVIFFLIFKYRDTTPITAKDLISLLFPVTFKWYWFMTSFILLLLISPILNKIWQQCTRNQKKYIIGLLFLIYVLLPFFNHTLDNSLLLLFIMYYLVGGYLYETPSTSILNKKWLYLSGIFLSLVGYFGLTIRKILLGYANQSADIINSSSKYSGDNSIFVVLFAISFFMLFKHIQLKPNRLINLVASSTFGIYLIHDNRFVRKFIWFDLFHMEKLAVSSLGKFILMDFLIVLLVFVVCSVIEIIRNYIFNKCGFSTWLQKRFSNFSLF